MQPLIYVLSASGRGSARPPRADIDARPPYTLLRRPEIPAPGMFPTDWREVEVRGAVGGGRGAPCAAVDTRRVAVATGPMDWRAKDLGAPREIRDDGLLSTDVRELSCEDEMGPSVVRRMALCSCICME